MKLVNLLPLKERDEPTGAFGMTAKELAATYSLKRLQIIRDEVMGDMEQQAEPEGGPIADQYADRLHGLDQAIKIAKGGSDTPMTYDQAVGKVSKDQFIKSKKFDRGGNRIDESEDKWNAIDVSRKAEKEIGNKEWNSRTTAKLDMLKALNAAGKFKKDFDEERLQGWVDQNYSWEKLSRQFKLNESYNNLNIANVSSMSETMQQGEYTAIEQGWDGLTPNERKDIIGNAMSGEARPNDMEKSFDQLKSEIPDFELGVANYLGIDEGSCGYGPDGEPGDTPGETRGMPADKRTMTMMREVIRKEIKKLAKETSLDDKLRGALGDKDFEKVINKPVPSFADMKPKPSKDKK